MPILEVFRDAPLTPEEQRKLPEGALPVHDPEGHAPGGVVARVTTEAATQTLLKIAFQLGQAIPGSTLQVKDDFVQADPDVDPWKLYDAGDIGGAERAFRGRSLDETGRDRVRNLFLSTDPEKVALAARIAGITGWKSFVTNLRRTTDHADVKVRRDTAISIGLLAGNALVPILEKMRSDPSPEVAQAARDAIAAIEERHP